MISLVGSRKIGGRLSRGNGDRQLIDQVVKALAAASV
jgi:hypothetical protein